MASSPNNGANPVNGNGTLVPISSTSGLRNESFFAFNGQNQGFGGQSLVPYGGLGPQGAYGGMALTMTPIQPYGFNHTNQGYGVPPQVTNHYEQCYHFGMPGHYSVTFQNRSMEPAPIPPAAPAPTPRKRAPPKKKPAKSAAPAAGDTFVSAFSDEEKEDKPQDPKA